MSNEARRVIFANFFGALHYFLTVYIIAPYLAQFMSETQVGLVYAAGALVSLLGFFAMPSLLVRISLKHIVLGLTLVQLAVLLGLVIQPSAFILTVLVIVLNALPALIGYTIDIFLEQSTNDEGSTGNVRGFFFMINNIALVLSPLIVGFLLGSGDAYEQVFLFAALSLIPFLALLFILLRYEPASHQNRPSLVKTFKCLFHSKDVVLGATSHFVMLLFFSWVAIYIPLYLHTELGIPWESLGWVFSVMLLPYVLLEYPIGILADRYFGEKELMVFGFAIMSVSLALVAFITTPFVTFFLVAVLVGTRIGGAITEITTETYFFKHVDGDDVNSISVFRMIRPLGALIGPLIGSLALAFVSLQSLFIVLGGLCLLGIPLALLLRDTR